jgi:hypothetical protein
MPKLPLGSRVKISPSSEFWGRGAYNPKDVEGVLVQNSGNSLPEFVYRVQWDNGHTNAYREGDLELVGKPQPKGLSAFIKRVEEEYSR